MLNFPCHIERHRTSCGVAGNVFALAFSGGWRDGDGT